jgi:SPP1 family phage portal protein
MIYYNKQKELTIEILQKMINHFRVSVEPKLQRYKNYYDGKQAILNKSYIDATKPCNKTVINYCKNIVDSYAGYLAAPSYISYQSEQDIEDVMDILRYNDYQAEDADFLLDALIYGTAIELMYNDNKGQTRFRLINPTTAFGIYDDSLTGDLMYFVRMYKVSEWDETDTYNVDVYNEATIKHYTMSGMNGYLTLINEEPHYFNQCPANIFTLPDEKSIFDCIISLQDAANELVSAEIDDYTAFCDAYLALFGCDADTDDIAAMKENRVLLLPEGATAQWLTKNASDTQIENILKRIHDSIYRISQCVDYSSETLMSGVASGISIRYKMSGMETRAA